MKRLTAIEPLPCVETANAVMKRWESLAGFALLDALAGCSP
jgi:hypothetical protein